MLRLVGQAFLYNAVTFDLGTILSGIFGVASGIVPYYIVIFAVGNFMGPLLLGRLFDTVGRKPMISGTYFLASALTVLLGALLVGGGLLDREIDAITRALSEHGPTERDRLAELVGARRWGPGRFRDG